MLLVSWSICRNGKHDMTTAQGVMIIVLAFARWWLQKTPRSTQSDEGSLMLILASVHNRGASSLYVSLSRLGTFMMIAVVS